MIVKVLDQAFDKFGRLLNAAGSKVVNSHYDTMSMRYGVFKLSKEINIEPIYWDCEVLEDYDFEYRDYLWLPKGTNASEAVQMQLEHPDKRVRIEGSSEAYIN